MTNELRSIRQVLAHASYTPLAAVGRDAFELRAHHAEDIASAFTEEFSVYSQSAFESLIEAERGVRNQRALAWASVKTYYAGYFAANALMRSLGEAACWLSREDFGRFEEVVRLHGVSSSFKARSGLWRIAASGDRLIARHVGASQGGAHEGMWSVFASVVKSAADEIAASDVVPEPAKGEVVLRLESIRAVANSGLPSDVRNAIQYRRLHGLWHPHDGFDQRNISAVRRARTWRDAARDLPDQYVAATDVLTLFGYAQALVGVALAVCEAGARYFEDEQKFFTNGPLRLVRLNP